MDLTQAGIPHTGSFKEGEQKLIKNVVHNLGCIRDRHLKKRIGTALGVDGRACKLQPYSWKISIAACLLGLPPYRVRLCCTRVETNGGLPVPLAPWLLPLFSPSPPP